MSDLAQVIADLTQLLPETAMLIAQPDTTPGSGHDKPHSKPPWNAAVANVLYDALEAIRRLHADIGSEVAGRYIQPSEPHVRTGDTLAAIARLAYALPAAGRDDAVRQLAHHVTQILQLPAIDREERWRKITGAACPYCQLPMLLAAPQSGRVTCLRYGSCSDSNGQHPRGVMTIGAASGQPMIAWSDGTVQTPPAQLGHAA